MILSRKRLTIKACKKLSNKYRNPHGKYFFTRDVCPLCKIHFDKYYGCYGCPLADENGDIGCTEFKSFADAEEWLDLKSNNTYFFDPTWEIPEEFIRRAEFFDKIIPILEKIPKERFTPQGWTYFKELSHEW